MLERDSPNLGMPSGMPIEQAKEAAPKSEVESIVHTDHPNEKEQKTQLVSDEHIDVSGFGEANFALLEAELKGHEFTEIDFFDTSVKTAAPGPTLDAEGPVFDVEKCMREIEKREKLESGETSLEEAKEELALLELETELEGLEEHLGIPRKEMLSIENAVYTVYEDPDRAEEIQTPATGVLQPDDTAVTHATNQVVQSVEQNLKSVKSESSVKEVPIKDLEQQIAWNIAEINTINAKETLSKDERQVRKQRLADLLENVSQMRERPDGKSLKLVMKKGEIYLAESKKPIKIFGHAITQNLTSSESKAMLKFMKECFSGACDKQELAIMHNLFQGKGRWEKKVADALFDTISNRLTEFMNMAQLDVNPSENPNDLLGCSKLDILNTAGMYQQLQLVLDSNNKYKFEKTSENNNVQAEKAAQKLVAVARKRGSTDLAKAIPKSTRYSSPTMTAELKSFIALQEKVGPMFSESTAKLKALSPAIQDECPHFIQHFQGPDKFGEYVGQMQREDPKATLEELQQKILKKLVDLSSSKFHPIEGQDLSTLQQSDEGAQKDFRLTLLIKQLAIGDLISNEATINQCAIGLIGKDIASQKDLISKACAHYGECTRSEQANLDLFIKAVASQPTGKFTKTDIEDLKNQYPMQAKMLDKLSLREPVPFRSVDTLLTQGMKDRIASDMNDPKKSQTLIKELSKQVHQWTIDLVASSCTGIQVIAGNTHFGEEMDKLVTYFTDQITQITLVSNDLDKVTRIVRFVSDLVQTCHKQSPPNYAILYLEKGIHDALTQTVYKKNPARLKDLYKQSVFKGINERKSAIDTLFNPEKVGKYSNFGKYNMQIDSTGGVPLPTPTFVLITGALESPTLLDSDAIGVKVINYDKMGILGGVTSRLDSQIAASLSK